MDLLQSGKYIIIYKNMTLLNKFLFCKYCFLCKYKKFIGMHAWLVLVIYFSCKRYSIYRSNGLFLCFYYGSYITILYVIKVY